MALPGNVVLDRPTHTAPGVDATSSLADWGGQWNKGARRT